MNNVLVVVLTVCVFGLGFLFGRITPTTDSTANGTQSSNTEVADEDGVEDTSTTAVEGSVSIEASSLTDGQKRLLSSLGIDSDTITVTPEMIACAETNLGDARVEEITNGATPSFIEGVKLVACYQ